MEDTDVMTQNLKHVHTIFQVMHVHKPVAPLQMTRGCVLCVIQALLKD